MMSYDTAVRRHATPHTNLVEERVVPARQRRVARAAREHVAVEPPRGEAFQRARDLAPSRRGSGGDGARGSTEQRGSTAGDGDRVQSRNRNPTPPNEDSRRSLKPSQTRDLVEERARRAARRGRVQRAAVPREDVAHQESECLLNHWAVTEGLGIADVLPSPLGSNRRAPHTAGLGGTRRRAR